jgi:hypothetical protein
MAARTTIAAGADALKTDALSPVRHSGLAEQDPEPRGRRRKIGLWVPDRVSRVRNDGAGRYNNHPGPFGKTATALAALVLLSGCAIVKDLSGGGGALSEPMRWHCDSGASFSAQILEGERARIGAGGRLYTLPRVGPGARYAQDGVTYVERGGAATLTGVGGGPYANCRR